MYRFFSLNRKKVGDLMLDNAVAIIPTNPPITTNGDSTLKFVQNNYLYYLSGIDQEETLLLLTKESGKLTSILYIKLRNPNEELWNGKLLSTEDAKSISGVDEVRMLNSLREDINPLILKFNNIYLPLNEHSRGGHTSELLQAFGTSRLGGGDYATLILDIIKKKFPLHSYHRLSPLIDQLREIKSSHEINLIKKATQITNLGLRSVLGQLKNIHNEREIEALLSYELIKNGATGVTGFAYSPIVASGKNSCTLHYITNQAILPKDSLVLLDIGAEYQHYSADITRCYPTSGVFPKRINQIYTSVLKVLKQATDLIKVGLDFQTYTQQVTTLVGEELHSLGLLSLSESKSQVAIKKYFMHGVSHFLGLEVHDVGSYRQSFKAGMLLTCEPGIYIPEENIGIRLENNLLLTEEGCENLSKDIPIEIEEIEELIN